MTAEWPRKPPALSSLYVLQFDQGTIKVGYSTKPEERIARLATEAAQFGITVTERWVSDPHPIGYQLEKSLIEWCARRSTGGHGAEWFIGLVFSEVRDVATDLFLYGDESGLGVAS